MRARVSVIMPSLNMGPFIDAALRSVAQQRVAVHEIVLLDAGSTDDTHAVVRKHQQAGLPIRMLSHPPGAPGLARNCGIAQASGDLIAFLDPDDLWPAGKLERQLRRLASAPEVDMVSGYVCYFDTPDASGLVPAAASRTERIFHVHVGACIYRREVFDRLGGAFDPDLLYGEDVDLLLRVREQAVPFTILRSVELYYRQHAASMMAAPHPRKASDFRLATFKSLQRRRAAGALAVPLRDFASYLEPLP
jgi:glycosyltransferase involved in cell wall biosynthesis